MGFMARLRLLCLLSAVAIWVLDLSHHTRNKELCCSLWKPREREREGRKERGEKCLHFLEKASSTLSFNPSGFTAERSLCTCIYAYTETADTIIRPPLLLLLQYHLFLFSRHTPGWKVGEIHLPRNNW